jgi:hypothetical protein
MPPGIGVTSDCLIEPGICMDPPPGTIGTVGDVIKVNNGVIKYLGGEFLGVVRANTHPAATKKSAGKGSRRGGTRRTARRR